MKHILANYTTPQQNPEAMDTTMCDIYQGSNSMFIVGLKLVTWDIEP